MIGVEIEASGTFARLAEDEERRFLQRGRKAVTTAARRLRNAARRRFAGARSGREYTRPDGRTYTAAAPGESPAVRTRKLRNSIRERVVVSRKNGVIQGTVGPDKGQRYIGRFLEFGTANMAARPFLRPAELEQRSAMERDVEEVVLGGES